MFNRTVVVAPSSVAVAVVWSRYSMFPPSKASEMETTACVRNERFVRPWCSSCCCRRRDDEEDDENARLVENRLQVVASKDANNNRVMMLRDVVFVFITPVSVQIALFTVTNNKDSTTHSCWKDFFSPSILPSHRA